MIGELLLRLREFGLETVVDRWYSKYLGVVTKNDDDQQQGRVKVRCDMLGRTDELLNWAYPSSPFAGENYGFYFPPEVGDNVWVWFENGDVQSPCYSGSWFRNPSKSLTPATSEVPAEFKADQAEAPVRRGIKTKRGHGLLFEDGDDVDEAAPRRVLLWSGTQEDEPAATKNRYLLMQDGPAGEKTIVIASSSGHQTEWRDVAGEVRIRTSSADGHSLTLDDTGRNILVESKSGHTVRLDDADRYIELLSADGHIVRLHDGTLKIEVISKGGHQIILDDETQKILLRSAGAREISLDDAAQQILVQNQAGQSVLIGPTGTTILEPGNVALTAQGSLVVNANGVSTTAVGGAPMANTGTGPVNNVFTGLATENFNGGLTQIINGALTITHLVLTILGNTVGLGPAPRFQLVDIRFFTAYLAHTHISANPGVPTGVPITGIPIPGVHTTINTTAS